MDLNFIHSDENESFESLHSKCARELPSGGTKFIKFHFAHYVCVEWKMRRMYPNKALPRTI